jgi:autotransporter-associated beta strand protein
MQKTATCSRSILLAAALFSFPGLRAATVIWDTDVAAGYQPGGGTWDTTGLKWTTDGTTLSPWASGDIAAFSVGTQGATDTINLASAIDIGGLTFGGGTPYSPNWIIAGTGRFNLVAASDITVYGSSTATISSVIGGAYALNKAGAGTLVLDAVNTYSGGTTLSTGQLTIKNAKGAGTGAITLNGGTLAIGPFLQINVANNLSLVAPSSTFEFSGTYYQSTSPYTSTLSGLISGAGGIVKTGSGALRLSGPNTYAGGTTINQGWIVLGHSQAAGAGSINLSGGVLGLVNDLTVSNGLVLQAARSIVDMNVVYGNGSPYSTTLAGVVSGVGTLVKTGSGDVRLTGANTFSGGSSIEAGYLTLVANQAAGVGSINLNGGVLGLASNLNVGNGVVLQSARSVVSMDVVYGNGSPYNSTLSGVVSGAGVLVKAGRGMVTLSGVNTYSGGTSIEAGFLKLANNQGAGSGVISFNGGNLELGLNLTVANDLNLLSSSGAISMNVAYGSGYPYTSTLTGVISGSGLLQKIGIGNVTLKGVNAYTGGTSIDAGWVTLGNNAAAGTGAITVNGGSLYLQNGINASNSVALAAPQSKVGVEGTSTGTLSGVISGTGTLNKDGTGTLVLTGANTFTGGVSVNAGSLLVNGSTLGATVVAAGASLGGTGSVGNVTLAAGAKITPGASGGSSIGTLTLASLKLEGASVIQWNLARADQAAGTGYDCLKVTGLLDLSAASSLSKLQLVLAGAPTNFDVQQAASFKLMDYGSLNLGSNTNISDLFAIDVSGLKDQNGFSPQFFQFSVVDDSANHQLLLNYTSAIPEPSTYGVSLGGLGLAIAAVRRRRRVPVA